ncbi:MAG: serine hydrolase [Beijerinckiaceae bacterium]|nr:serine hydrolase [Beijerinckiaceae bacterium]
MMRFDLVSRRIGSFCLALAGLAAASGASSANPALLVDADTGAVLYADEATRPWHPASTAKMMTVYLALKAVKQGKLSLDTPLAGTKRAAGQRPSKIGIRPGQIITLDNALKILLVKSANDLAYVIGEAIGGNADNFVGLMNQEAAHLGMRETVFTNPNGWHDPRQQVSARDLAKLALALLRDFPDYRDNLGIGSVQLGNRVYKNTNGLIGRYPGAMGLKTGFVCASGFNVVALANRNGRTLLAVVLGASSGAERTVLAAQLLDRGFAGGSGGSSLDQLPASGEQSAPDIRSEVCGRNRRGPLTEEDFEGAVSAATSFSGSSDKDSIYATIHERQAPAASVGHASAGRYQLEERSLGVPVAVYMGRAPGNTEPVYNAFATSLAQRPAPAGALTGFAPVQAGIAGGSILGSVRAPKANGRLEAARIAAPTRPQPIEDEAGEPIALAPTPPLRPGAAAAIRPRGKIAAPAAPTLASAPATKQAGRSLVRPAPVLKEKQGKTIASKAVSATAGKKAAPAAAKAAAPQ